MITTKTYTFPEMQTIADYVLDAYDCMRYKVEPMKRKGRRWIGCIYYQDEVIRIDLKIQVRTLLHEIAHAISFNEGHVGHGKVFERNFKGVLAFWNNTQKTDIWKGVKV